jgi:hypothetical protein
MLSRAKSRAEGTWTRLTVMRGAEPTWEPKKTLLLIAELTYVASIERHAANG